MSITHFTINFSSRYQSRYTIYNYNINRLTSYQPFRYFQTFFTRAWLRNSKLLPGNTTTLCIFTTKSMFSIDVHSFATKFLSLSNDM